MRRFYLFFILSVSLLKAQQTSFDVKGKVVSGSNQSLEMTVLVLKNTAFQTHSDANGNFVFQQVPKGTYTLVALMLGFKTQELVLSVPLKRPINIILSSQNLELDEVVVTGTMKEISKSESPVNIDIITPKLMQKTAVPNLFEATSLVNGVKPQINCNVCNTGDIHINGMEGPYTLILIDGMPIVSGLSSVYGLMGIPTGMMERLEIAKGPAAALYGSEAMGGTINLITKYPGNAPRLFADYYATSYGENNLDLSARIRLSKKINWLMGANGFYYNRIVDHNKDGFTDVTLQKRVSLFNKFNFERKEQREFSIAARYVYEDRWGGETNWSKSFRGGDSIYGESVYVRRTELISKYQWPTREKIYTQLSYNFHDQNSVYGVHPFLAKQSTAFAQTYWTKTFNSGNDFLLGMSYKNLWFDDNTVVTSDKTGLINQPDLSNTFGLFVQNESTLDSLSKHKVLLGLRLDYQKLYQLITSPRIAYKWTPHYRFIFRANFGTGFRVVNVFTEDHAALTGAREVVFVNDINPEQSYNGNLNVVYKMKLNPASLIIWDASLFYYHFTNKIIANYDADPNKVIYDNLNGYAYSRGMALNANLAGTGNVKFNLGITYADVQNVNKDSAGHTHRSWQLQSPKWSGNFMVSYSIPRYHFTIDLSGNWYGTQRLPVLPKDYRPEYSPAYSLINLQFSKFFQRGIETYAGVKNLLNFMPEHPLMRPQDPFDKNVNDPVNNPNGYTFDTAYNYAPLQGIRFYMGFRLNIP